MAVTAVDRGAVIAAIRLASARSGVGFDYLLGQARIESGLDRHAAAPTSSARGLFQFTAGTWLDMVRRHGDAAGLGWAADALRAGADPATRAAILNLRHDAGASAALAAAYAKDNAAVLERDLGRTASATDLYLAHFLGSAGALRFLRARDADPGGAASGAVLPAAARSNAGVFTAPGGRARTLGEVYARFEAKLSAPPPPRPEEGAVPLPLKRGRSSILPLFRGRWPEGPEGAAGNPLPPTGTPLPVAAARAAYLLLAAIA